jgi:Tol biopolymer transport system component
LPGAAYERFPNQFSYDDAPVWSPDGSTILFVSNRANPGEAKRALYLYKVLAVGGTPTKLAAQWPKSVTVNNVGHPAWAANGLVVPVLTGHWDLWRLNEDGSNPQQLFTGAARDSLPRENGEVVASHNGGLLLFQGFVVGKNGEWIGARSLWRVRIAQYNYRDLELIVGREGDGFDVSAAFAWSPDDSRLAVVNEKKDSKQDIWLIDAFAANPVTTAVQITKSGYSKSRVSWGRDLPPNWHPPACRNPVAVSNSSHPVRRP